MPKPPRKGKEMSKAKVSKAVSSVDVVNADLKASFEAVVNLEAEISVYEKALQMLNAGTISVRGLKATIEAAQEKGALPTIKPSTAQYFVLSASVRALAGGKDKPLKEILNATIQAKRAFKGDTAEKIAEAKSFADLVKSTPKQGEKAKAEKATLADVKAVLAHADGVVALALKSLRELSGDEALIKDVASAKALIKVLEVGIANSAHPAIRSKVSA
jgi:hypothetical protein